ncbi:hypothetical protein GmHk_09G025000 [Glycine max]|nr:hypothetical protein GmHk_09G025000 [Glycine max]
MDATKGKFARVYMEIDLNQPIVRKVWFRDHYFRVEYEGLHFVCKKCGLHGHIARTCPQLKEEEGSTPDSS